MLCVDGNCDEIPLLMDVAVGVIDRMQFCATRLDSRFVRASVGRGDADGDDGIAGR